MMIFIPIYVSVGSGSKAVLLPSLSTPISKLIKQLITSFVTQRKENIVGPHSGSFQIETSIWKEHVLFSPCFTGQSKSHDFSEFHRMRWIPYFEFSRMRCMIFFTLRELQVI